MKSKIIERIDSSKVEAFELPDGSIVLKDPCYDEIGFIIYCPEEDAEWELGQQVELDEVDQSFPFRGKIEITI